LELKGDPALRASTADASFDALSSWAALGRVDGSRVRSIEERIAVERERFLFQARKGSAAGRFTGVAGEGLRGALEERFSFDAARPLSPKALEEWGRCRFRGFASRLLKLRADAPPGLALDAAGRGDLCHRALRELFCERKCAGQLPIRGDEDDLRALGAALARAAAQIQEERPVGHPALFALSVEEAHDTLVRVIRRLAKEPIFDGLVPQVFEEELSPVLIPGPDGQADVAVAGRVDRVDVGTARAAAVDYKSSRAAILAKRLREGFLQSEFQLAVYAAALGASRGCACDAAYFSLSDAKAVRLSSVVGSMGLDLAAVLATSADGPLPAACPTLAGKIWEIVLDVRAGLFPAGAADCAGCGFGPVCRFGATVELEEATGE
jgi:RecB family exonuclease